MPDSLNRLKRKSRFDSGTLAEVLEHFGTVIQRPCYIKDDRILIANQHEAKEHNEFLSTMFLSYRCLCSDTVLVDVLAKTV